MQFFVHGIRITYGGSKFKGVVVSGLMGIRLEHICSWTKLNGCARDFVYEYRDCFEARCISGMASTGIKVRTTMDATKQAVIELNATFYEFTQDVESAIFEAMAIVRARLIFFLRHHRYCC